MTLQSRIRTRLVGGLTMLLVGGIFVALPGAVAVLPACDIPSKTCSGEQVNALETDAGEPEPSCTRCIQSSCCDAVGTCDADPACVVSFKDAHACVIANGAGEESRCTTNLTPPARTLYTCMRKSCGGATCRVPSCDVDRAAGLIVNPECDRCIGGACCEAINTCYGDRRCKLIIECIIGKCQATLGTSLEQLGLATQAVRDQLRNDVCTGRAPAGGPDACLTQCITDFAPVDGRGTTDDQSARCRAIEVFTCGAGAKCGRKCVVTPSSDAGDIKDGASGD